MAKRCQHWSIFADPGRHRTASLLRAEELAKRGQLTDAEVAYKLILERFPDAFDALVKLGGFSLRNNDPTSAKEFAERALVVNSQSSEAYGLLGATLRALNRHPESVEAYRKALTIDPYNSDILNDLGVALITTGRLQEAVLSLRRAIRLNPCSPAYYLNLVRTRSTVYDDEHVATLEALAKDIQTFSVNQQVALRFALAGVYADRGQHEESFEHLLLGNQLKRRMITYDEENRLGQFDRIRQAFTASLLNSRKDVGYDSEIPIFVFGMPRSGTTLVEQILAAHPAVHGAGEIQDFKKISSSHLRTPGALFPESVVAAEECVFRDIGTRYVAQLRARNSKALRITDKMPANLFSLGLIHLALPHAKLIHVRRSPIDTCLSCFSILFNQGHEYTYNLAELGRYYHRYETLMSHWRDVLPRTVFLEIDYGDIIADIETEARRLVTHCGLDWNPACLEFHRLERPILTASAGQVRKPLYDTSIGRWRPKDDVLEPLLNGFRGKLY